MARNSSNMHTTRDEVRAVAKAIGASLKRQGHPVPHSNLLNAVAAALNKRDWATLRGQTGDAAPRTAAAPANPAVAPASTGSLPPELQLVAATRWAKYLLRLAYVAGKPVRPIPDEDAEIERAVVRNIGRTVPALMDFNGERVPVEFDFIERRLTAQHLPEPTDVPPVRHRVSIEWPKFRHEMTFDSAPGGGWQALAPEQLVKLMSRLAEVVPQEELIVDSPTGQELARLGPRVSGNLGAIGSEDGLAFDAREYLASASGPELARLIQSQFFDGIDASRGLLKSLRRTAPASAIIEFLDRLLSGKEEYELSLSKVELLRWCLAHRPFILADIICLEHNIRVVRNASPVSVWDWVTPEGERSVQPFETAREATIDAMVSLGLYDKLLANIQKEDGDTR